MRIRFLILMSILLCGFCGAPQSDGHSATATVRGQVLKGGQFPQPGVQVTLNHPTYGRSTASTTGADGMYYFYNVPFGDYYLEIWVSSPALVYQVRVATFPYSDLPRAVVP